MKRLLLTAGLLGLFWAYAMPTRASEEPDKSPKHIVEEFCKFETSGGRLTESGWQKASLLFVHPTVRPAKFTILVTDPNYSVWDPVMKGPDAAVVVVGVAGDIWRIDPDMQITRNSQEASKSGLAYELVRTEKHWELAPDGKTFKESTSAPEWRIQGNENVVWLTRDAALSYFNGLRSQSNNPRFRQHVDKVISTLKRQLR